jgi:alpha-ketoglutarate-dependent taurine dioxygenase
MSAERLQVASFQVQPLEATFGALVTGVKLAELDDETFAALYRTWLDYALLIFPGQHLVREQQVAFARRFGEMEFDFAPISNVRPDGSIASDESKAAVKTLKGNEGWHQDSTYMPVQAKGAVFSAHVVPEEGGETGWCDMRAAYDALDDATRAKIAPLKAHHSLHYSQAKIGYTPAPNEDGVYADYGMNVKEPPLRPLVKIHPETRRPMLAVGRHAYGVPGLAAEDSESLLASLIAFAAQPPRIYHHRWTPGDVVIWDNRALMHRARPWDMTKPRVMYHSRIAGDRVAEFAAPA